MPIKSLKKLSPAAKKMWESVYKEAKGKYGDERAAKIAWEVVKKNYRAPSKKGRKSATMPAFTQEVQSDNYINVLIGAPQVDAHGEYHSDSFWEYAAKHSNVIKGDMEHYYKDRADGMYVDDSENFEGWVPVADKFEMKDDGLYARVELPASHPFTPTFLEGWKSGEYGVSMEYVYPEEAVDYNWIDSKLVPTYTQGVITGFSFTKDPALNTKNKNE